MFILVPLTFVALFVALRHRRGRTPLALGLLALGGLGAEADPSLTLGAGAQAGRYQTACGPNRDYGGGRVSAEYRRRVGHHLEVSGDVVAAGTVVGEAGKAGWQGYGHAATRVGLDHRWAGGRLGVAVIGDPERGTFAAPSGAVRLGPRIVHAEAGLFDRIGGPLPAGGYRLGVGISPLPRGGVRWNHPLIRAGVVGSDHAAPYLGVEVPIGRTVRLDVEGSYWGRGQNAVSAEVRYRIPLAAVR